MKILVGSVLVMMSICQFGICQPTEVDIHDNKQRADQLLAKVTSHNIISDSSEIILSAILEMPQDLTTKSSLAEAHYLLGKRYLLLMQDDESLRHFRQAQILYTELDNPEKAGFATERLGLVYLQKNQLDSALMTFHTALEMYQATGLRMHMWTPYLGISNVYKIQNQPERALRYAREAVSSLDETSDRLSKVMALSALVKLAHQYDSISLYIKYADEYLKLYSPIEIDNNIVQHIGHFYEIEDPVARIAAIQQSIDKLSKLPVTLELISSYFQLGKTYEETGDTQNAIDAWSRGYRLEEEFLSTIHFRPALANALSTAFDKLGDDQAALEYFKIYSALKESLIKVEMNAKVEELQIQYDIKAKDAEILDQRVALTRRTWQRNGILALLGIFFVGGAYVIFTQRRHLRDQATIAQQGDILHKNQIRELTKEHELASLQTLMTAQEEERNRIAQDLHDSLGGSLATLQIQARRISEISDNGKPKTDFTEYLKLLDNVSADVRRIAHNMMPQTLIRMGLSTALADLAQSIESSTQLQITFHNIDYMEPVLQEKEIMLYRIAQELCANTLKHANAKHLLIQLSRHNGTATLVVEDDGIGFDMTAKESDGFGLNSIQSRVRFLHGELEMMSAPNEGTSVTIQIPVI